jgi:hypothetical protein
MYAIKEKCKQYSIIDYKHKIFFDNYFSSDEKNEFKGCFIGLRGGFLLWQGRHY